jgi:hypothetical protein
MLKCLTNSSLHWRQTPITNLIREDVFMKVSVYASKFVFLLRSDVRHTDDSFYKINNLYFNIPPSVAEKIYTLLWGMALVGGA